MASCVPLGVYIRHLGILQPVRLTHSMIIGPDDGAASDYGHRRLSIGIWRRDRHNQLSPAMASSAHTSVSEGMSPMGAAGSQTALLILLLTPEIPLRGFENTSTSDVS